MKPNLGEKDEISTEFKLYLKSHSQNRPQWSSEMPAIIYHNTVADLGKKAWLNNFSMFQIQMFVCIKELEFVVDFYQLV